MEKYILTGGPGVGKTTILNELEKAGEITLYEVAREIIAEQKEKKQGILPWTDLTAFQKLVMLRQVLQEEKIKLYHPRRIFQDRSLADGIAYAEEGGVENPEGLYQSIERAGYTRVFYLEQLPFYNQDQERKENAELALRIHQRLYQVYDHLGFDIITVPAFNSIEERVQFVLKEAHREENREIEKKYRVDHAQVKGALQQYLVNHISTDNEENTLYDFHNILKDLGCVFRIRKKDDEHILTVKGPNQSADMTNKPEYNFLIPSAVSKILGMLLPASISYPKRRENYRPLGDSNCTISLDYVSGLGEFVEIEASTKNQVRLWEKRLQLTPYAIKDSYPQLARNKR